MDNSEDDDNSTQASRKVIHHYPISQTIILPRNIKLNKPELYEVLRNQINLNMKSSLLNLGLFSDLLKKQGEEFKILEHQLSMFMEELSKKTKELENFLETRLNDVPEVQLKLIKAQSYVLGTICICCICNTPEKYEQFLIKCMSICRDRYFPFITETMKKSKKKKKVYYYILKSKISKS